MLIVLCTHHCYLQSGSFLNASYGIFPRRSDCQKTAHCSIKHFHPPCRIDRPLLFLVCQCIIYKPNTGNNIFLNDSFFRLRILLFYEYDIQFCHFDFFIDRKVLLGENLVVLNGSEWWLNQREISILRSLEKLLH